MTSASTYTPIASDGDDTPHDWVSLALQSPSRQWKVPLQAHDLALNDLDETLKGAKAMTEVLSHLYGDEDAQDVLYMRKLPDNQADLDSCTNVPPADLEWAFPGYDVWECLGPQRWQQILLEFASLSSFEVLDFQSDVTMSICVINDSSYDAVPIKLKILFVTLTVVSFLLEAVLALQQTANNSKAHSNETGLRRMRTFLTTALLNYLSTPMFLMVAPFRLAPFGASQQGRNAGQNAVQSLPLVLHGEAAIRKYLEKRLFLVKIPKIFLENLGLTILTIHLQHEYVGKWGAAAIVSTFFSIISLLKGLNQAYTFLRAAHFAKRYLRRALEAEEGSVAPTTLAFAKKQLTQFPLSCPCL